MIRTGALLLILGAFTAFCTASPARLETPPATPVTGTAPAAPTPRPTSTPTPTLPPTPAPLHPRLVSLCPADRMVPLSALGLEAPRRLLVFPETVEIGGWDEARAGLFVIAPDAPTPQRIEALLPEGSVNSSHYDVSPDGKWLVFNRRGIGQESGIGWISSLDGAQQWPLSRPEEDVGVGWWLDASSVLLTDIEGKVYKIINPFTMEAELLTHLPEAQIHGIGSIFFRDSGRTFMLYQAEGYEYRLFDPSTRTDQQVLEWLSAEDVPFLDKSIDVTDGWIVIRVARPYGLDISPAMRVEEMMTSQNYTQTMQPVILPDNVLPAGFSLLSPNTPAMILYRGSLEQPELTPWFYWLDYQQQVITDYCFAPLGSTTASISPDGKFVAFTRFHLPSIGPAPKSIFVLNLATGYITQIDGYQFEGWGWADE